MKNRALLSASGFCLLCTWAVAALAADNPATSRAVDLPVQNAPIGETLEDFFSASLEYNPRLRIAAERVNVSSARRRIANGRLLPQINATSNLSDNRREAGGQTQNFSGDRFSLQLNQVLFNWQAFAARSQAYLVEDQSEAEYFGEVGLLLSDVADRYFTVLQSEEELESIRSELNAIVNQVNQVQSLYDRQLAQITDLYEAQARLAAVQAEQLDLQSRLELSREALRAATGVSAGQLFRLDGNTNIPPLEHSAEYWVAEARSNNPLIRAREFAVQAAEKRISEQRGAYMPRVALTVQQLNSDLGFENAPVAETDNTFVGLDITFPLFAGGSSRAAVSEASSQRNIVENELRQIQLEVAERTRTAYLQVKSSEMRTQAARKLLESTVLSAQAMQRGYELGTVTSVDVLNALRDRFQAERDLQNTRYEHLKFLLQLKLEAGVLTTADLMEISGWLQAPEN